jgi:tetratricopeptide (TPR) repeat protein
MNINTKIIALILSIIFPGLGQVFMQRLRKGILLYVAAIILWWLIFFHKSLIVTWFNSIQLAQINLIAIIILAFLWLYNLSDIIKLTRPSLRAFEIEKRRVFREGLSYYVTGQFQMAIPRFIQMVKIDPRDIDGILYLGMCYEKIGKKDKADKLFGKYTALVKESPVLREAVTKFLDEAKIVEILDLARQSRPLTNDEYAVIQKHPQRGYEILSGLQGLSKTVAMVALQHHERFDGKGYPCGLGAMQLGPIVQLISLVDVYEALTHPRPYRAKKKPDEALKLMLESKEQNFSKEFVKILIEELSFYPPGTRIQLNTGETGEVIATDKASPLKPLIRIQTDAYGSNIPTPRDVDLAQESDIYISKVID